ncbi:hypothetical protein F4818DRAFT_437850 [Hypoxylon cercidicola]|nr:hypothetical protein F4818DRAFT_437850 [Hypoxylon cercidicola]
MALYRFETYDGPIYAMAELTRTNLRPTQPPPNMWAEPSNYGGSMSQFMANETAIAYCDRRSDSRAVHHLEGKTYNFVTFSKVPSSLGLSGLWGCSSLVIVSQRGAWVNHMLEAPEFMPLFNVYPRPNKKQQDAIFMRSVLASLWVGHYKEQYPIGLPDLRQKWDANNPEALDSLLADDAEPHVFLFAPYQKVSGGPNKHVEFPIGLPMAYVEYNGMIKDEIQKIFGPAVPFKVVPYAPLQPTEELFDAYGQHACFAMGDEHFQTHRGKVLVQYRPASGISGKASWRVWFEGRELTPDQQHEWDPMGPFQVAASPPPTAPSPSSPTQVDPADDDDMVDS